MDYPTTEKKLEYAETEFAKNQHAAQYYKKLMWVWFIVAVVLMLLCASFAYTGKNPLRDRNGSYTVSYPEI